MERQSGKIKLRPGDAAEGLRHIELRHGNDVRALGYADAITFVADVAQRFDAIYKGNGRAWVLATLDRPTSKMNVVLELEAVEGEGDFYDVKNATPTRSDQFKNKKPVWSKEKPLAASTGPSGAPDESGSLNPRDSSGSKNIAQQPEEGNTEESRLRLCAYQRRAWKRDRRGWRAESCVLRDWCSAKHNQDLRRWRRAPIAAKCWKPQRHCLCGTSG